MALTWVCWMPELLCLVEVRICDQIYRVIQEVFIQAPSWPQTTLKL